MATQSYVLMSIGPVQGYIQQARRTQDLYAGSRLLSVLAGAALVTIKRELPKYDGKIIYPEFESDDEHSLPNRFLFRCDSSLAKTLAGEARLAVYRRWEEISASTKRFFQNKEIPIPETIWTRQAGGGSHLAPWIEVQYVITDYKPDYREANEAINRQMAARKLFRDFIASPEPGFKCSVTGEHEALYVQSAESTGEQVVRDYWMTVRGRMPNKAILNDGERLCALSAIKRFAHEADEELRIERFPSTSSIASAPFRTRVLERWGSIQTTVTTYLQALWALMGDAYLFKKDRKANPEHFPYFQDRIQQPAHEWDTPLTYFMSMDGDFFYEETLQEANLRNYVDEVNLSAQRTAVDALKALYRAADMPSGPSDYLAFLAMDGDQMGKIVTEFSEEDYHRNLSNVLANFARENVPKIVEIDAPGRVIYAGGDDLLAMLPLANAFRAAEAIRIQFADLLENLGLAGQHMSAGIAIVHRTHSLQHAIQSVKMAEYEAKHSLGRNAFMVQVLRRSGEEQQGGSKWQVGATNVVELFGEIVTLMSASDTQPQLSHGLPYDMEHFLYALVDRPIDEKDPRQQDLRYVLDSDMRDCEFKRILERRYKLPKWPSGLSFDERKEAEKIAKQNRDSLRLLLTKLGEGDRGQRWHDVAVLLRLARFIAQEAH